MFGFLSRWFLKGEPQADLATLTKGLSDLYEMIGKMQTNIARIEQ